MTARLAIALSTALLLALPGSSSEAASAVGTPPNLLGMVGAKLVVLDPATLRPLASPRPLLLERPVSPLRPVLSPDGTRVAVPGSSLYIVDRARLRIQRRIRDESYRDLVSAQGIADDLIWTRGGRSFIFAGVGKFGLALYFVGGTNADNDVGGDWVRTPEGLAVLATICCERDGVVLWTYSPDESDEVILPFEAPAGIDARRNRMFLVSSSGQVVIVNLKRLTFDIRSVTLPSDLGSPDVRGVAWAGRGHVAFWGSRGLGVIDTRAWSTRVIDARATDVRIGANALIAWNGEAATGVTVYSADGELRFRALGGRKVAGVGTTARYAYVNASGRFSIDLRTGRVRGPLTSGAVPILPDLLSLP